MAILVSYLDIKDSAASPALTFRALYSTDSGNNTGWEFIGDIIANLNKTLGALTSEADANVAVIASLDAALGSIGMDAGAGVLVTANLNATLGALECESRAFVLIPSADRALVVGREYRALVVDREFRSYIIRAGDRI